MIRFNCCATSLKCFPQSNNGVNVTQVTLLVLGILLAVGSVTAYFKGLGVMGMSIFAGASALCLIQMVVLIDFQQCKGRKKEEGEVPLNGLSAEALPLNPSKTAVASFAQQEEPPLVKAFKKQNVDCIKQLIESGESLDENIGREPLLFYAMFHYKKETELLQLLVSKASPERLNQIDHFNRSLLDLAMQYTIPAIVAALVERGISLISKSDSTVLHYSVKRDDLALTTRILSSPQGEELLAKSSRPTVTPVLSLAFKNGMKSSNFAVAKLLLERGALVSEDPLSLNDQLDSYIHCATRKGDAALVQLILKRGDKKKLLAAKNGDGQTPYQVAEACSRLELIDSLTPDL